MVCYAEINKTIRPTGGNSGLKPFCVTTSVGFSCWSFDMKTCQSCQQIKSLSEFYPNRAQKDGLGCWCKICQNNYQKTKKGKISRKRYDQSEKGKANRLKGNKKYRKTEKCRANCRIRQKRYYIYHQNQILAQRIINKAVREGKIPRPDTLQCYDCFTQAEQYHHWLGYEPKHWLDVIPVCIKCHHIHNRKVG